MALPMVAGTESARLEAMVNSANRGTLVLDPASSSLREKAMEYLSFVKKQWQAFRLAHEMSKLEVPNSEVQDDEETSQNGEGLYSLLSISNIRRTLGITNSTTPQLLKYAAMAAPLVMIQAGAVGCGGASSLQFSSRPSCDSRISLKGTNIDPKLEDAVNSLKDYICYRYVTEKYYSGLGDKLKAFIRQEKGAPLDGYDMRDISGLSPLNKHFIPKGIAVIQSQSVSGAIYSIIKTDSAFNAHIPGILSATAKVVYLGDKLFSTNPDRNVAMANLFNYNTDREEAVVFLPYKFLQRWVSGADLERLSHNTIYDELGHVLLKFEQKEAQLVALSAGIKRPVKTLSDIRKYVDNEVPTWNKRPEVDNLSKYREMPREYHIPYSQIINELGNLHKELYGNTPRLMELSDQKIQAFSYYLLINHMKKKSIDPYIRNRQK